MKQTTNDGYFAVRKTKFVPILVTIICTLIVMSVGFSILFNYIHKKKLNSPTINAIVENWKKYDYSTVYTLSSQLLEKNPFNNAALTYHGYACFYLAVSQLDNSSSQSYLDDAINSLRLAHLKARPNLKPQLEYILGKSYFYKNSANSYYYADLAVKYLQAAKKNGYTASDISEYLGLSYASLGMIMESISAFTEALLVRESDTLLLSIAEQYYKAGQSNPAKQYLFRIKKDCENEDLVLKSMNLLGTIYIDEANYTDAKTEFETILKKNPNSADAYYGLGVIYEKQGDMVKARSEWRKAIRLQVNHAGALAKIAEN